MLCPHATNKEVMIKKYIVSNGINEYIHVTWLYGIYQVIIMFHIVLK